MMPFECGRIWRQIRQRPQIISTYQCYKDGVREKDLEQLIESNT